jgi:hypothetical protein
MLIAQIGGIRKSVQTAKLGKQSSPRQAVASMLRVGSLQQFKNHMVRQADLDPARSCHLGKFLSYFRDRSARRRIVHGRVVGRVEVYSNRPHFESRYAFQSERLAVSCLQAGCACRCGERTAKNRDS